MATHVLHRFSTPMQWSVTSILTPKPAVRSLVDAWTAVEWEHLTLCHFAVEHASQIFYTMWYHLWAFLIQCLSLSASLKIGPEILDKSLAASWLQVVTYPCCSCLSMKLEINTLFLRCKLGKPHIKHQCWAEYQTVNFQLKCQLLEVMWSQELPWNPFVSKPAPPAGIVSHYHVFLMGGVRMGRRKSAVQHL